MIYCLYIHHWSFLDSSVAIHTIENKLMTQKENPSETQLSLDPGSLPSSIKWSDQMIFKVATRFHLLCLLD